MSSDHVIGLAGATGAVGTELLSVLDGAPWRPKRVVPYARASSTVPFVAYGESQVAVDDIARLDPGELDALLVATPREAAGAVVDRAAAAGIPVVDLSGSQSDRLDVPLVLPWLGLDGLDLDRSRDVVAIPSAPATLVASLLRPLLGAGWSGTAEATVYVPASSWGRDGIDELSRQVVAMFNTSPPPRRVFPSGLAFDLLPTVGTVGASGWTAEEVRATLEIARLTGVRCDVSLVAVPLFSGMSATLRLADGGDLEPEALVSTLTQAGILVDEHSDHRSQARPRKVEGKGQIHAGRVRRGMAGGALHLWAAMDNLRVTSAASTTVLAAMLRQPTGSEE